MLPRAGPCRSPELLEFPKLSEFPELPPRHAQPEPSSSSYSTPKPFSELAQPLQAPTRSRHLLRVSPQGPLPVPPTACGAPPKIFGSGVDNGDAAAGAAGPEHLPKWQKKGKKKKKEGGAAAGWWLPARFEPCAQGSAELLCFSAPLQPPHGRRDEAAPPLPPPPPPPPRGQLGAAGRQQDPQAVLGAAGHPGHPGAARGPGAAGQRRPRRPGRGRGAAGGEGRDGPTWSSGTPWGAGQPRRGRRARREGGAGRVRRAPPLGFQRQALGGSQPPAGRAAHPLRRGAGQRAGPLRPGHGQVHLRGARPLLFRRPRHRLPCQPAVRPDEERAVGRLLLPVLRELAQAHLALRGRPGPPGARGRGVGAGGGRGLQRFLRQRQDGQHLHRFPRLLLLAQLRRLRLSPGMGTGTRGVRAPSPARARRGEVAGGGWRGGGLGVLTLWCLEGGRMRPLVALGGISAFYLPPQLQGRRNELQKSNKSLP